MKASDLDRKIEICKQKVTKTDFGRTLISYEHKLYARARVNYSSGNRIIENEEIFYSVEREFIVRSYVDVSDTDIIKYDGNEWQILSIDRSHDMNDIVIKTAKINN